MIVLAANLTSSIIQPLFGYLSDQIARRWILPVSVFALGRRHRAARPGARLLGRARAGDGHGASAWPRGIPRATRRRPAWRASARPRRCRGSRWAATSGIALGPAPDHAPHHRARASTGTLGMLLPAVAGRRAARWRCCRCSRARRRRPRAAAGGRREGATMPRAMALLILVVIDPRVGVARLHDLRALLLRRHAQGRPAHRRPAALRVPRRRRARAPWWRAPSPTASGRGRS